VGRKRVGVELREKSIRIGFSLDGQWERVTLKIPPTPKNEIYALRLAQTVDKAIENKRFTWAEFFPDHPRAKSEAGAVRTFGEVADLYVQSIGQLSIATKDQYENAVGFWKSMFGEKTDVEAITHEVLKAKIGGHPWASPKLMNNHLIPLRGIFALLYHGPNVGKNPIAGIVNAKSVKKKPDPLSAEERDKILAHMAAKYDPRIWCYFAVAFYTGMRPEELIALRWGDIDWTHGSIHVQRVRTFRGSERDGSKTHTERDVDMVEGAIQALQKMKAYTFMKDPGGDIFENPVTGRSWHDERSQRDHYWTPTLLRLGIRTRRPYSTRHTYATTALMAGVNPNYVARQLGHTNTRMLFEKYAKWIDGADKGLEKSKLDAAFGGNTSPEVPRDSTVIGRRDWTRTNPRGT
jgi:integrase